MVLLGVIGKPNAGKSTFFKSLTMADVEIASYPFTTIKKNEGVAHVRVSCVEQEFRTKCKPNFGYCLDGERFIPVKIIDVAGLVPGAHEGKGRGNQFLDDLRDADALIFVIDASGMTDEEGQLTQDYDISREIKFVVDELDLWLHGIIEKNWYKFARKVQTEGMKLSQELAKQLSGLKIKEDNVISIMNELNLSEKPIEWTEEQILKFSRKLREKTKPLLIAANKSDLSTAEENIKKLNHEFPHFIILPCSSESELALREAAKHKVINYLPGDSDFKIIGKPTEQQQKALNFILNYLKKYKNTGVQQCINDAIFKLLEMKVVYPVEYENKLTDGSNNILPDAFLMEKNVTTHELAAKVHTYLADNFTAALDVRSKKKLARDYILKNKDVVKIFAR